MDRRVLLFITAIAALVAVPIANAAVFEVQIIDNAYVPSAITVAVGDSIHWTNMGIMDHTVTSGDNCTPDGDFDSGTIAPGGDFGYLADEEDAGLTIDYFCMFHCALGMVGSYTVEEANPTEQTSWGKIKSLYK